jgi:hypothetical protein
VLLVAAIMALMMSMGPAFASHGTYYGTYGGGQGGGPNGGHGGGGYVVKKHKFHLQKCWYKRHGEWRWYWCYR